MPKVKEYGDILWNNLPYTGLYTESVYAGQTFKNFELPNSTKMSLVGSPLPVVNEGVDKSLQLIGFSTDTTDGPVSVDTNGRLVPFSPWLLYRIKWRVSSKCTIGFYTPNYLTDVTEEQNARSVLLINDNKPSVFKGQCGCFTTSYIGQLFVITNRKVAVELHIEVRAPESLSFPTLELFKPLAYDLPNGKTYAYETKVSQVNRDVTFVPTRSFIDLTSQMKSFLIQTSVLLDFSPIGFTDIIPLQLKSDDSFTLQDVQTKLCPITTTYGGAPGVSPTTNTAYYFVLSLDPASVSYPNFIPSGYAAQKGLDGTFNTLVFPASTNASDPELVFINYTFTVSNIKWDGKNRIIPGEKLGRTISGGFVDFKNEGRRPAPLLLDDGVATSKGELIMNRSEGSFELQIVLPGTIGDPTKTKLVFNTLSVSFDTD